MSRKNRRTLGLVALLHVGACAFALIATLNSGSLIKRNQVLLSQVGFEVARITPYGTNRSVDISQVAAYPRPQRKISQPRDSFGVELQKQSFAQVASFLEARGNRDSRDGVNDGVGHIR